MSIPFEIPRKNLVERRSRLAQLCANRDCPPNVDALLVEIDAALTRIEQGTYGVCETCHDPIEPELIASDPLVRFCIDHLGSRERRRLEQDLELAARVQSALTPCGEVRGAGWAVHTRSLPAGPVGGDYSDVLVRDGESPRVAFFIGDVAGKGIAASLLMTQLSAIVRVLSGLELPLETLVDRVNCAFSESGLPSQYATLACGIGLPDGRLELVNAGHCPPLVVRRGEVVPLAPTGVPVGLFCSADYTAHRFTLERGDMLFLHTDGLSEAQDGHGNEFGLERVHSFVARQRARDPRQLIDASLAELDAFRSGAPRADDLTLMVVTRL